MRSVGRYRLAAELGRSAGLATYRAVSDPDGQPVELEVALRAEFDADAYASQLRAFRRHAAVVSRLAPHPGIAYVYDAGEANGAAYLARETLNADSLDKHDGSALPADEALRIVAQLAGVLGHVHDRGFVHRDVKPAHILVAHDGSVRLSGFDIATEAASADDGAIAGTPAYMAPEQITGGPLDGRADLFAAGIVLYQLLTGVRPFRGEDAWQVAKSIVNDTPAAPSTINPALPAGCDEVVMRALAKHADERYAGARELAAAIQALRATLPRPQPQAQVAPEFSLRPGPDIRTGMGLGFGALGFAGMLNKAQLQSGFVLFLIGAALATLVAFVAGYRHQRRATQLRLNAEAASMLDTARAIVLYLRPFISSGRLYVRNALESRVDRWLMGRRWDAELALSLALESSARVVAIGETRTSLGAAKLTTDDAGWQALMQQCAERASVIVVVPYPRPSTLWEVAYLFARPELLRKTLFLMPPSTFGAVQLWMRLRGEAPAQMWRRAAAALAPQGIVLPAYARQGCWFTLDASGREEMRVPLLGMDTAHTLEIVALVSRLRGDASAGPRLVAYAAETGDTARAVAAQEFNDTALNTALVIGMAVFAWAAFR